MQRKNYGALESIFPCDEASVLDHMITMQEYSYSISEIASVVGLGYSTASRILLKLEKSGFLKKTKAKNKTLFQADIKMKQTKLINNIALEIAFHKTRENP